MARIGVVLLTMGEPDNTGEIRPYLRQLLADPDLARFPIPVLQPLFAWAVSRFGKHKLSRSLTAIGGGSPLRKITKSQAAALEKALSALGDYRVYAAMRYGRPSARDIAGRMMQDKVERAVALPLYPQYCRATFGSSLRDMHRGLQKTAGRIPVKDVDSWPEHAGYVSALAEQVAWSLDRVAIRNAHLLLSAHSVPMSFIAEGDPYLKEIERTAAALRRIFPDLPCSLAFQSRTGRGPWLGPDIGDEAVRLGRAGVEALVVVPLSFVSDNSETLYDLDIVLRRVALDAGINTFLRVAALNDSPAFIAALKDMVLAAQAPS